MKILNINIPFYVKKILDKLTENGYNAYMVGGCVRDFLLLQIPHDYDICTNCLPCEMLEVFKGYHTIETGLKHGTLTVMSDGNPIEITTYRSDGEYLCHRKPQSVTFETSLSEDLKRRDFTVNAMCLDKNGELIDLFGGVCDLKNKVIKCVGDANKRFDEDALRIMRALRFASTLDFSIEEDTKNAIFSQKHLLKEISKERIFSELKKLLVGKGTGKILLDYREVFSTIIPQIQPCFDFQQNCPHHCYDVYEHICRSVDSIEPDETLRLVMFFHDIGKPEKMTVDSEGLMHFKKHQYASADISREILQNLKCDKKTRELVFNLIWEHDNRISAEKKSVRKMIAKYDYDFFLKYLAVRRADTMAQSNFHRVEKLAVLDKLGELGTQVLADEQCFKMSDLDISGWDIMALGYSGKDIGKALNLSLEAVINEEIGNKKEEILGYLKEHFYK